MIILIVAILFFYFLIGTLGFLMCGDNPTGEPAQLLMFYAWPLVLLGIALNAIGLRKIAWCVLWVACIPLNIFQWIICFIFRD
jgi:ABC-type Na+ efflux pump permease subunit